MSGNIRIAARSNARMRAGKTLATIVPAAVLWLIAFAQVLAAIFSRQVFYAGRFTHFHAVTYREEPTLFVFVVTISFLIVSFFGWVILRLIPKPDQRV